MKEDKANIIREQHQRRVCTSVQAMSSSYPDTISITSLIRAAIPTLVLSIRAQTTASPSKFETQFKESEAPIQDGRLVDGTQNLSFQDLLLSPGFMLNVPFNYEEE